jgi:hypothetical protein
MPGIGDGVALALFLQRGGQLAVGLDVIRP